MKANKTIRWKVVDEEKGSIKIRSAINFLGFTRLYYRKGEMTIAPKNSIGNCCFNCKKMAIKWLGEQINNKGKIIKVKTYGKGKRPTIPNLMNLGEGGTFPEGTICYPAVMALE